MTPWRLECEVAELAEMARRLAEPWPAAEAALARKPPRLRAAVRAWYESWSLPRTFGMSGTNWGETILVRARRIKCSPVERARRDAETPPRYDAEQRPIWTANVGLVARTVDQETQARHLGPRGGWTRPLDTGSTEADYQAAVEERRAWFAAEVADAMRATVLVDDPATVDGVPPHAVEALVRGGDEPPVRVYDTLAEVAEDFTARSPEYQAALDAFHRQEARGAITRTIEVGAEAGRTTQEVAAAVVTELETQRGGWFLNPGEGVPYFTSYAAPTRGALEVGPPAPVVGAVLGEGLERGFADLHVAVDAALGSPSSGALTTVAISPDGTQRVLGEQRLVVDDPAGAVEAGPAERERIGRMFTEQVPDRVRPGAVVAVAGPGPEPAPRPGRLIQVDPANVTIHFGGQEIRGFTDGAMISVERQVDHVDDDIQRLANRGGSVTCTLVSPVTTRRTLDELFDAHPPIPAGTRVRDSDGRVFELQEELLISPGQPSAAVVAEVQAGETQRTRRDAVDAFREEEDDVADDRDWDQIINEDFPALRLPAPRIKSITLRWLITIAPEPWRSYEMIRAACKWDGERFAGASSFLDFVPSGCFGEVDDAVRAANEAHPVLATEEDVDAWARAIHDELVRPVATEVRTRRLDRAVLGGLAARYAPARQRPGRSARRNRHDAGRWLRAFRQCALIANDALQVGDRKAAIRAFQSMLSEKDSIELAEPPWALSELVSVRVDPPGDPAGHAMFNCRSSTEPVFTWLASDGGGGGGEGEGGGDLVPPRSFDRFHTVAFERDLMLQTITVDRDRGAISLSVWLAVVPECYRRDVTRIVGIAAESWVGQPLRGDVLEGFVDDIRRLAWRELEPVTPGEAAFVRTVCDTLDGMAPSRATGERLHDLAELVGVSVDEIHIDDPDAPDVG